MSKDTVTLISKHFGFVPYVFVVGCPRSGTTLLQRMLDSQLRLAAANDRNFIGEAIDGRELGINPVRRLAEPFLRGVPCPPRRCNWAK